MAIPDKPYTTDIELMAPAERPKISIENVSKIYNCNGHKKNLLALDNVSLDVQNNEFVSVVGTSGCGKSTLLRLIAGLEVPSTGCIKVNGLKVNEPGADRGMVFQSYTLFPWLTVEQNIQFGLKLKGLKERASQEISDKYLDMIELKDFAKCYPKELSGGMKQRVAIARALANKPEVLLMDEPFGALDPQTKQSMQELLLNIWQKERTTIVFVTHDIEEAIFLSKRVFVMNGIPGKIKKIFQINLSSKRTIEVRDTEQFFKIKREIVKLMSE